MLRVGLVGAGPWARLFHAPLLAAAPDIAFTGVWARDPAARADLAAAHGTRPVDDVDTLVAGCDAVAFAVPPDVQAELATRAARAGRHLLLDKPIARTVEAATALAAAVADTGVASLVVLTHRFRPDVTALLATLATERVAALRCAMVTAAVLPGSVFATPWRTAEPHGLLDLGPHALDLALTVAGPVRTVTAGLCDGVLAVSLRHEAGATSQLTLSAVTPGAAGGLELDVVTDRARHTLPALAAQDAPQLRQQVAAALVDRCAGRPGPGPDVHDGLAVTRLITRVADALAAADPAVPRRR